MALTKVTYTDGATVIYAQNLNDIQDAIIALEQGGGGGGSSVEPYTSNPAALGTASPGSSDKYARGDHVHAKPSASDVGAVAVAQGVAHAGEFVVVGSDGNITTMTLATWQGGNYGS